MSSSSVNMLRTRRKDNNVKPNRRQFRSGRLDRKSSRGMIYENEELRLRTININAEIERGQYDIKKLKRENELLKKEIWCLRDEYEKLDKLLKEKEIDFSSSSTTSDSDSCSSCMDESDDFETVQNTDNAQNTLNRTFEALSVVPEESTENSDRTSLPNEQLPVEDRDEDVIQADQSYPCYENAPTLRLQSVTAKNFFSSDRLDGKSPGSVSQDDGANDCNEKKEYATRKIVNTDATNFYQNIVLVPKQKVHPEQDTMAKAGTDVLVKLDNRSFRSVHVDEPNGGIEDFPGYCFGRNSHSTFSNGGNLEELLNDIETISQDILAISNSTQVEHFTPNRRCKSDINPQDKQSSSRTDKPFKSEINVTLMPQPMALIGLEKYRDIHRSMNTTPSRSMENIPSQGMQIFDIPDSQLKEFPPSPAITELPSPKVAPNQDFPNFLSNLKDNYVNGEYFTRYNPENFQNPDKTETNQKTTQPNEDTKPKNETANKQKVGLRKKVSIHFRGKKDKIKALEIPPNSIKKHSPVRDKKNAEIKIEDKLKTTHQKTSSRDSNKTTSESDTKNNKIDKNEKTGKNSSVSPDRKKAEKKCKKHKKDKLKMRRATITSLESRDARARSHSANTERSNTYGGSHFLYDEYAMNSERDSMSSCDTFKTRQMNFTNISIGGKVPWCGCWGNGCI